MAGSAFDYVIVGAGSAGCVLANRLTEDPDVTVLLLEAGPADRSLFIHMPAAMSYPLTSKRINWMFMTEPEPALNDRAVDVPRGRVLGGSSSINGMVFVRGNPLDYDGWAAMGLPAWSYAHCLPYFRKMETFSGGVDAYRSVGGPLGVSRCDADNPIFAAYLEAGAQAGHHITPDHNGYRQEGLHVAQMTIRNGRRSSTAVAYLRPASARPNLTVRSEALVTTLRFDGRRAVGVDYRRHGMAATAEAAREVIVATGSIGSPHLLLRSGIGDPQHLAEHDVPLVAALPAVGRNLEDHPSFPIQYEAISGASPAKYLSFPGQVAIGLQ